MNRSFRAPEKVMPGPAGTKQQRQQQMMGSFRKSVMKEKEEELGLFLEMRKREKERDLLHNTEDELDSSLGSIEGSSQMFSMPSATPARKTGADEFLNSENDKNDYDWLLTPPGTPLFPSLEMESQKTIMGQIGTTPKARPTALKSRLSNTNNMVSRQPLSSPGLSTSSSGLRRPNSSGGPGSRPATPTGRPTLGSSTRPVSSSIPKTTSNTTTRPASTTTTRPGLTTTSRPTRSSTPTSRPTVGSTKPVLPARSSTPTPRSTARSSTPTPRSTARSSTPTGPTSRPSVATTKPASRAATPTRRQPTLTKTTTPMVKSPTFTKPGPNPTRSAPPPQSQPQPQPPPPKRASSPSVRPRPWKPQEMPGYSLDAPPNLRTSLSDRPTSATRGRPGAPSSRSSSVEPVAHGRVRRQSCSPSRGRLPNGLSHNSGSSVPVPASNRAYAKAHDNLSPGMYGTKMVERVVNMRKLVGPKQDDKSSPHSNKSSPDGFGRSLSKKSLDMAIRHMDIRRTVPGNLRPLMSNIPASSMYSVRAGPTRSRAISVSDSPLATSSNASSEMSVNNSALCLDGNLDDEINSQSQRGFINIEGKLLSKSQLL